MCVNVYASDERMMSEAKNARVWRADSDARQPFGARTGHGTWAVRRQLVGTAADPRRDVGVEPRTLRIPTMSSRQTVTPTGAERTRSVPQLQRGVVGADVEHRRRPAFVAEDLATANETDNTFPNPV
jgi:hypothetical protein